VPMCNSIKFYSFLIESGILFVHMILNALFAVVLTLLTDAFVVLSMFCYWFIVFVSFSVFSTSLPN